AVHIPLDEIERRHDEVEPEPGQAVAVICHHGVRSMRAALALRALGVQGCLSVAGGIEAWSLAVDSGVPRYERAGGVVRPLG
ncbi:MAG: rhodanese-like domain-containing protein, partial [Phycisphaerales bacterium]